jgi:NADH:ubiquinone oxidoreductase subunit 4 (subunit M)
MTLLNDPGLFLWLVPVLPALGAAMAVTVPGNDRLTLRGIGMLTLLGVLGIVATLVVDGWDVIAAGGIASSPLPWLPALRLTSTATPALLTMVVVAPLALRAGAPRVKEGMAAYVIAILLQVGVTAMALLLQDLAWAMGAALVSSVPGFALVALFGGPERGTVTWRAAALWVTVDGAALAIVVGGAGPWPPEVVAIALLGPGLVRLAAGPHGLWALPFFEMAPVASASTAAAVSAPMGAVLLWRGAVAADHVGALDSVAVAAAVALGGAAAIGAVLVVVERDLRRIVAHWGGLLGSIVALGVVAAVMDGRAVSDSLLLSCHAGLSTSFLLVVIEAIERRLETRRVNHLAGLATLAPVLAGVLPLAVLLLAGAPGPGTAPTLWSVLAALVASSSVGVAGAACVAAVLVGAVGAAGVMIRVVTPQPRKHAHFIRMSPMQTIRLVTPLGAMLLAALATAPLQTLPQPSSLSSSSSHAAHADGGQP